MHEAISYEDKLAFVTDFIVKLPKQRQVEFMEVASCTAPIQEQVDTIYDHLRQIVERDNPGLRPDKSQQASSNALCPAFKAQKSD